MDMMDAALQIIIELDIGRMTVLWTYQNKKIATFDV